MLQLRENDLNKIILIGDRVLLRPTKPSQRTESGLLLPQGMHKSEELRTGYVIRVGPGFPIPMLQDDDQPWKDERDNVKYVPLQPREGDLAVYQQNSVYEIQFNGEDYVIASHRALLMVVRDEDLLADF
ncbi:MAG: co-chaperone GroES family protein [Bacteroidota bacterium]